MILDEILAHKRREVELARSARLESTLIRPTALAPRRFASALRQPGVSLIAEFKRKSPSGGALRPGASAADLARTYAANGAAALSVLTDFTYFGGSDDDLIAAREAGGLTVLRKDFVIDAYQIHQAHAIGADAVLLIVRAVSPTELRTLLDLTHRLDMDALVETHSADEVRQALDAGARVIGVNNRDLDTLVTDVSLAPRLRPLVPAECVFVAESGISSVEDIAALAEAGVDAVLVGESLVRAADPGNKLRSLVAAGVGAERAGVTLVKVCGMRTLSEARVAVECGANFLGFIFWQPGKRYIPPAEAAQIIAELRREALDWAAVGVFVDPSLEEVEHAASVCGLDYLQLSGNESAETVAAMPRPTWKAIHVRAGDEAAAAEQVASDALGAARYLLDTHAADLPGGTGVAFDWQALQPIGPRCIVAGGLRPDNVARALETLAPLGVDVSSGVEFADRGGGKDPRLVRAFLEAVRTYDNRSH